MIPVLVLAQTQTENYVKTTTYKGTGATFPVTQITYFDGLGRPIQQIANAQSHTGKDIVTHIEYDTFGRQIKDYLPYANTTPSLNYNSSAGSETGAFYNTPQYESTPNPYSEKLLENSPLNRVLKQAAPGTAWALGSGHEIKLDYQTNTATEVKYFKATAIWNAGTGLYDIAIANPSNYPVNSLYKTVTKDENWKTTDINNNTTREFKNKKGQVVLKRTFNAGNEHDTYYIFDQYGNLTYVLPPLAEGAITPAILDGLCYQYKYDYRNRQAAKKIPGKQWEYFLYDTLDRPVAMGPVFSPWGDGTEGVLVSQYDIYSRVTQTGYKTIVLSETTRNSLQNDLNAGTNPFVLATNDILTKNYYDNYTYPNAPTLPTTLPNSTYPIAQKVKGLPTGSWTRILTLPSETTAETAYTFYDGKYRPVRTHTTNYLGGFTQVDSNLDFIGKTNYTVTTHKRLDTDEAIAIKDMFTYSAQDRLLLHKQQINDLPVQLIASNTYNELGQLTSKNVGGADATGALGLQKVDYNYNIRGWLKGINDIVDLAQGTNPKDLFAFKLSYNTPTTATALYNGNISETFWKTNSDNVLRKYNYTYDNLNRLLDASYSKPNNASTTNNYWENLSYDKNGNIIILKRNGDMDSDGIVTEYPIDNLAFTYDPSNPNQLLKVFDETNNPQGFKDDSDGIADNEDDYSYDANGNLTTDTNKGITSIIYNHLNLPTEIVFNNNESTKIKYIYNAIGQKVSKEVAEQYDDGTGGGEEMKSSSTARMVDTTTQTDYLNGFQYKNMVLQFFPHTEGYVNNTPVEGQNTFSYVFNYTDHLGNVRLSYTQAPNMEPLTLTILQENHYYPFGLKHTNYNSDTRQYESKMMGSGIEIRTLAPGGNSGFIPTAKYQYLYGNKESQTELDLNVYDFEARVYMPDIPRTWQIDVLSENYMNVSGYAYCLNNPLRFIDPTGMAVEEVEGGVSFTEDDAVSAFNVLTGKSKNAFVEVVGNKKTRASMNNKNKNSTNGPWSVFAVENLGVGAKMLDVFSNSSLDNLVVSNHGGASSTDSYFEYGTNEELDENNSIITSEIKSFNNKGGVNLSQGEKEVLSFVQMGNKVKNGGNFVFAFCTTGKGDIGQQTLSELKTLLGDRMNIFLPRNLINIKHGDYPTGPGFIANYKLDYTTAGWLRSTPGIKDATTIRSISITSNPSQPLKF